MKILTCEEVREAERESIRRLEMSTLVLMERAGYAVAQFCLAHFEFESVCVVCGKGNNGGDGLVAAEALRPLVRRVYVLILAANADHLSPDASAMCARLESEPIWIAQEADLESQKVREALGAGLILDAIVGTGFKPPLRGLALKAVAAINQAQAPVVAVDLPSGVDADSMSCIGEHSPDVVACHGIITFIAPKPAHVFGELTSGPIAVSDLRVQPAEGAAKTGVQVVTGREVHVAFPARKRDANKGQFGHVLVIAGSNGKSGAAALAGLGALRAGAGLVTIACPRSVQALVAGFAPELMTEALAETPEGAIALAASDKVNALMEGKTAVVLGPGLSRNSETTQFVHRLVAGCGLPLVLDADALNAFEGRAGEIKSGRGFHAVTPHPGEAARLMGASIQDVQQDRIASARRLAAETGACAVLKGSRTVVADPSGEVWINMTGNAAMAKGGSGDVLSGMVGAVLARRRDGASNHGMNVAAAVYLHGLAGDFARDTLHENTVLVTDLLAQLTTAFKDCDRQVEMELFYLQL